MAKYIIDTNIFISSLWNLNIRAIFEEIYKRHEIYICEEIIKEYLEIINRLHLKNIINENQKKELQKRFKRILNKCKKVEVSKRLNICRDNKDDIFLSLALETKAHYIISGDKDLLEIDKEVLIKAGLKKLKIIRISDFWK